MATPIPRNQASFTMDEVLAATGGELREAGPVARRAGASSKGEATRPQDHALENDGARTAEVSTDTRSMGAGALFVALAGEKFDAHDHLEKAVNAGARVLVVERDVAAPGAAVVRVPSTLRALRDLARAHLAKWRALGGTRWTIAITGSAGKTTTRVATQALFERLFPGEVHATKGNLNNLVGAPMAVFGLTAAHRYGVFEIGTNRPGEIEALATMLEPDAGLITLVAEAHVEELGSLEGVAHEKAALFRALRGDGSAIGNGDNDLVRARIATSPARSKVLYGTREDAAVRVASRSPMGLDRSRLRIAIRGGATMDVVTPLLGEAGALACAAAIAAATACPGATLDEAIVNEAFAACEVGGGAGRLVPMIVGDDVALIDDSYNANPASMKASIRAAKEIAADQGRRLVLVLGEMRELGVVAESAHDEVGAFAREIGAGLVIAVGELARRYGLQLDGSSITHTSVSTAEEASKVARDRIHKGDLVLVKGSRGIGTDAVVRALMGTTAIEGHA